MAEEMRALHSQISEVDDVPPGWFTIVKYSETVGIGRDRAAKSLERAVRLKKLKTCFFRIDVDGGSCRKVKHYQIIKG